MAKMTVGQLIEELSQHDSSLEVCIMDENRCVNPSVLKIHTNTVGENEEIIDSKWIVYLLPLGE